MTDNSDFDLIQAFQEAIELAEEYEPLTEKQLQPTCVQAASLIAQVVDFLECSELDDELLGIARAIDNLLELLITTAESL